MKSSILAQEILLINLLFVGKLRSSLIFNAVTCDFSPKICSQSFCMLSKARGNFKYFSAGCNLINELNSAELHIELLRKYKTGEYRSTNLKLETNLCKLSDSRGRNGIMMNLLSMTLSSLNKLKCPLKQAGCIVKLH
ncbi:uncharacterized protein [Eurosta solidaginis]|uniref:uncharacterized protein isoform X2 n=1 Tax=Eurosta solidaginis TaxID=178769 RepID=UPI0035312042